MAPFEEARAIRAARVEREPDSFEARAAYADSTAQVGAELYREALRAFDAMLDERPDDTFALANAVETRIPASEVLAVAGAFDEAESTALRAIELARSGLEREPSSAELRRFEALARFNVGLARRLEADSLSDLDSVDAGYERALIAFRESLASMQTLADEDLLLPRERGYPDQIRATIDALEARLAR